MAYSNAIFYLDPESGNDAARTSLTGCIASNPSGSITRITKSGHGLVTGACVTLSAFSASLNGVYMITVVSADSFDLDNTPWMSPADSNGTVVPFGGTLPDPWKTLSNGATAVRIAPGDTIRIKKSPDPVSMGVNCTFTNASPTITLASALTRTISRCETSWSVAANVTGSLSTTRKEGSFSQQCVFATAFTTGVVAFWNLPAAINLTDYTKVTLWFRSSVAHAAGVFSLVLYGSADATNPLATMPLPAARVNLWIPYVVAIPSPSLLGSVACVGLVANSDPGTPTILIDNIEACNNLSLQSLIGKNTGGEPWYAIQSIVENTVSLVSNYYGASEAVTGHVRACFITPAPGVSTSNINNSGASGSLITFTGGWNFSTAARDGESWFDGLSGEGSVVFAAALDRSYIGVANIFGVRYSSVMLATGSDESLHWHISNCGAVACGASGFSLNNLAPMRLIGCYAIGNAGSGYLLDGEVNVSDTSWYAADLIAYGNGSSGIRTTTATTFLYGTNLKAYGNVNYGVDAAGAFICDKIHTLGNSIAGLNFSNPATRLMFDAKMDEATPIVLGASALSNIMDFYSVQNYGQVAGDHRRYYLYGSVRRNTAEARGGSGGCMEMIPSGANPSKLRVELGPIPAVSASGRQVTIYLKKSANYNGTAPRIGLWMDCRLVADMTTCSVTTSYAQFSIAVTPSQDGVLHLVIDCDGTAGSIYVDDLDY